MQIILLVRQVLLWNLVIAAAASIHPVDKDDGNSITRGENKSLADGPEPPNYQHLNLPILPSTIINNRPPLSKAFDTPSTNFTTPTNAAALPFQFRVPHSTIELYITTTKPIDGRLLGNALLFMHEVLNDHIAEHGDGPLAPKDDPFLWKPDGPPGTVPRVALSAESVKGVQMTWSVLLVAVEGLYLCLPAVGREYAGKFEIWDWRDQAQWGYGEVKAV